MARSRAALLAACCIAACAARPAAATVAIEGDAPRGRVTVTIRDTGVDAALRDLGRAYGFAVKGALGKDDGPISATISGRLDDVLARLLRNVNHVIVRSPDHRSGIEKVVIMGRATMPQAGGSPGLGGGARPHPELPAYPAPSED